VQGWIKREGTVLNFWLGLAGWSISIAYTLVFAWVFLGDEKDGTVSREISITDLTEKLADLAHRQWSGWMEYLFEKSTLNDDGTVTIPKWAADRWKRQVETAYADLPEEEKESDREEARRVIEAIFKE
jgi:hypothetical protein